MSEAVNNPYKQEAPDKTLTQEGVAADAKAVGDALAPRTVMYVGNIGDSGESDRVTYDMSGKPNGVYMACFFRTNRICLLYMNNNTLEWTSATDYMSISGNKVTFLKLNWYDSGDLFKLV